MEKRTGTILRTMEGYHKSVLLKEVIEKLFPTRQNQDGLASAGRTDWYLDCTLGDGGHSLGILALGGNVLGIDVDPKALERVRQRFDEEGIEQNRYKLVLGNFRDIKNLLKQADTEELRFAGAIFDLGVSSLQLENPERGFSFMREGPLDMRMDPSLQVRALDLIKVLSRKELNAIFKNLGEEKYSRRLADALVLAREVSGVVTTEDLAYLAQRVIGGRGKIHPATKAFQALRIAVNDELGALRMGLDEVKDLIEKNGHILVISFHSLEDRIVKNTFKAWQLSGIGEVVTKKPITPSIGEVTENPRSRSAKLRVFKKI